MRQDIIPRNVPRQATARPSLTVRAAKHALFRVLSRIETGRLEFIDGDERHVFGHLSASFPVVATVHVHSPEFYPVVAFGGNPGTGEAYFKGLWSCDDLVAVVRIFVRNREMHEHIDRGLAWLARPLNGIAHFLRRNSRRGSRQNIAAHYDLGNEFYRLFLDDSMAYSSAIFERADASLEEAQRAKIDRLCRKLQLGPETHLLEIGTGWGAFALHAAREYGCRITTTTISEEQHRYSAERIREAGLSNRIELLRKDYRDLEGQFDRLVHVEMIEAVGHRYFDTFFGCCSRLLKPDGAMAMQAIVIRDDYYEQARRSVDFIKKYIFPGSCIPSIGVMCGSVARSTDLRLLHQEDITPSYALTLKAWRERFLGNAERLRHLGLSDTFLRLWEYYLAYCEGGFRERSIGVVQMLFQKPLARSPAPLISRDAI